MTISLCHTCHIGAAPALERLAAGLPGGGLKGVEVDALEDASRNVAAIPKKYDPANKKRDGDALQQQPKVRVDRILDKARAGHEGMI